MGFLMHVLLVFYVDFDGVFGVQTLQILTSWEVSKLSLKVSKNDLVFDVTFEVVLL